MNDVNITASVTAPEVRAFTLPAGPKGVGIRKVTLSGNLITIEYDDGNTQTLSLPGWWFGTRAQYNALTAEEKAEYSLHFIEEGT